MKREQDQGQGTLVDAFQEDHARMGRGLHRLGEQLRVGDERGARAAAQELDAIAGPHIAFEEAEFYPRLIPVLGAAEVDRLHAEHEEGLRLVRRLLESEGALEPREMSELLHQCEAMEVHIAECGALFGAIGDLSAAEQESLHRSLHAWRNRAPRWTEWARRRRAE